MITTDNPFENEPVPKPTGEPNTHPSPRCRGRILLSRHRIVKWTVKVAERNVDSHPGNRELGLAGLGHTR